MSVQAKARTIMHNKGSIFRSKVVISIKRFHGSLRGMNVPKMNLKWSDLSIFDPYQAFRVISLPKLGICTSLKSC